MQTTVSELVGLPPRQQALRDRCFHPTGTFTEFRKEEIEQSIGDRFEDQARRHAQRLAVKTKQNEFTYDELNKAANRIAHVILASRGEGQEQVGLLCHQGAAAIAGTLGALKAGKTYVPLDPTAPNTRNRHIIGEAQIGLVVADNETFSLACELAQNEFPIVNIDDLNSGSSTENPGLKISPDRLSLIMYTSGSTGEPKGVVQNHRNVLYKA
ncbi:MAG: AMP-binding protein, partial [Candidatus Binatia bacterium]